MRKIGIIALVGAVGWLLLVVLFFFAFRMAESPAMEPSRAAKFFGVLPVIFGLFSLGAFGVWVYSLVHLIRNRALRDGKRILRVLMIVFLNLLGSILYFLLAPEPQVGQPARDVGET